MSNVKKMFLIPSDFYESLMQRSKTLTDPVINARIESENEKEKIVKNRKPADEKVRDLVNVLHKQNILDETIKQKQDIPQPVHIVQTEAAKKRGRPPKEKETYPEFNLSGDGDSKRQAKLLDNFYIYDPSKTNQKAMRKATVGLIKGLASL